MSQTCSCGSKESYEKCCAPFHKGKSPQTAEQLLRSRYSAFVLGNVPYILATHHSETRKDVKQSEIEEWSKESQWIGLEIEDKQGGEAADEEGAITFHARYRSKDGKEHDHHERSLFKKEGGEWRFHDAQGIQIGTFKREEPKVGRNDPCPCGSGKKFKKCHAA